MPGDLDQTIERRVRRLERHVFGDDAQHIVGLVALRTDMLRVIRGFDRASRAVTWLAGAIVLTGLGVAAAIIAG